MNTTNANFFHSLLAYSINMDGLPEKAVEIVRSTMYFKNRNSDAVPNTVYNQMIANQQIYKLINYDKTTLCIE